MDFMSYPSMDAMPFQHQNNQLFDYVDENESLEMEQLLAAAFDSSSSELFQCCSNDDDICFDPLYSVSEFLADELNDAFLAHDDINHVFVGDEKNDVNDAFLADDKPLFPQNLIISPFDHCYQLDNKLNHSDNNFNKRQKMSQNDVYKSPYHYNDNDSTTLFKDFLAPPQLIETPPPPPPFYFSIPPVFSHGICSNNNNNGVMNGQKKEEERSLSAQSLSARQRRRKISEKTKELGKLVPGGQKMNTAEMFEAASGYIKFLQAQFAILQLMESSPSPPQSSASLTPVDDEEALQCLLVSPLVQEKLYSKEKCIVPKGLVESLENHNEIQSNSQIKKDVRNLILTFC